MAGYIDQDTFRDDAVFPMGNCSKLRTLCCYLDIGVPALPHPVLIPDVTQGVDVRNDAAVINETKVIHHEAAISS